MRIEIPKAFVVNDNLKNMLKTKIDSHIEELNTNTIGLIKSFDPETQTATVQPVIKRIVTTHNQDTVVYESEECPILANVPVVFPGGGGWFMTFPVAEGDECLLLSTKESIAKWKANGGVQDPSNYRRKFSLKDTVAVVGIQSKASSLPEFNDSEPELRNRDGSVKLIMTESGITLMDSTDNAVRYSELATAYNELNDKFNGLISVLEPIFTGTPISEPGSGSPSALQASIAVAWATAYATFVPPVTTLESTGDITGAKVEEILVPSAGE